MSNILSFLQNLIQAENQAQEVAPRHDDLEPGVDPNEIVLESKITHKIYPLLYTAEQARKYVPGSGGRLPRPSQSNHPEIAFLEECLFRSIVQSIPTFRYILSDSSLESALNEVLSDAGYTFKMKKFRDVISGELIEYRISWEDEKGK